MSRAYDLFEAIRVGGFAHIDQMVNDAITEELFLDYKQTATIHPSHKLSDDDRKNFSKAISGFGNSDGGILIWGVNCRKDKERGDVPIEMVPIANATWFKTLLDGAMTGLTLPAHGGVENIAVPKPNSDAGVVASYIPEGMDVPYQSTARDKPYYYMRAGSSFEPVTHGVLAGMFGRRPQPFIVGSIEVVPNSFQRGRSLADFRLVVALKNEGRGIAGDLHYMIEANHPSNLAFEPHTNQAQYEWAFRKDFFRNRWAAASKESFQRLVPDEAIDALLIQVGFPRYPKADFTILGSCGSRGSHSSTFQYHLASRAVERVAELILHDYQDDNHREMCEAEAMTILRRELGETH